MEVTGLRSQVPGLRAQVSCLRSQVFGLRSQDSGLRSQVSGLGCLSGVIPALLQLYTSNGRFAVDREFTYLYIYISVDKVWSLRVASWDISPAIACISVTLKAK